MLKSKTYDEILVGLQAKCKHQDASNWIPRTDKKFVKVCLSCNKLLDEMEIE
jgi:hypothetical protein